MKKKKTYFDVWVRRDHSFTAKIEAENLEQAIERAKGMTIEQLMDVPGETVDSEHRFTAVLEA